MKDLAAQQCTFFTSDCCQDVRHIGSAWIDVEAPLESIAVFFRSERRHFQLLAEGLLPGGCMMKAGNVPLEESMKRSVWLLASAALLLLALPLIFEGRVVPGTGAIDVHNGLCWGKEITALSI
jgi:hypothetical protein